MWPVLVCAAFSVCAVLAGLPGRADRRLPAVARIPGPASDGVRGLALRPLGLALRLRGLALRALRRPGDCAAAALTPAEASVLADHLAALAVAGLPPRRIWAAVAASGPTPSIRLLAGAVAAGQRRGESSADALRGYLVRAARDGPAHAQRADRPVSGAAQLAVALDLSERAGAGLAETLRRFADGLRADQRAAAERAAALAGPQATAAVLGLLPLAGLGLGAAVGTRPWHALLATAPGRACLLAGGLLWAAGRVWTRALVRRAGGPG